MISECYDLNEFIGKVMDEDVSDIILMAQDETTVAERIYWKNLRCQGPSSKKCRRYAEQLKMLITFLRYNVRASGLPRESIKMLKPQYHA